MEIAKTRRQAMLAVRLDEQIEKELDRLAKARGSNRSAVVREAILQYLEDNEDLALAKAADAAMKKSKPLAQLRKELGLDR
jgi:RHH-type rel operon transcriptional repressor/antitoxin RelB